MQEHAPEVVRAPGVISKILESKTSRNPSYSLTALARDLGVSTAFLSQILHGKKRLNLTRAIDFCEKLNLDDSWSCQLLEAVVLDSTNSPHFHRLMKHKFPNNNLNTEKLELDQFMVVKDWSHIALLELTTCNNFRGDINWMAQRLRLKPQKVKECIERLLRVGLLVQNEKGLHKKDQHLKITNPNPQYAIRCHYHQMLEKAQEQLKKNTTVEEFQHRRIRGATLAFDPDKMEQVSRKINDFIAELTTLATDGDCREVYHIGVQFLPLTQPETEEPAQ